MLAHELADDFADYWGMTTQVSPKISAVICVFFCDPPMRRERRAQQKSPDFSGL